MRQIFNPNQRFGGMIILLAGDHGQLPPICALPLYSDVKARGNTETKKCFSGYIEHIQIRKVCFLEKVERVDAGEQKLTDMLTAVRSRWACRGFGHGPHFPDVVVAVSDEFVGDGQGAIRGRKGGAFVVL